MIFYGKEAVLKFLGLRILIKFLFFVLALTEVRVRVQLSGSGC